MCADRCGITSWPSAESFSASSTVASIPWLGDEVTVTVDAGGSSSAFRIAFSSGMSSYFGRRTSARSAARCSGASPGTFRFQNIPNAQPFGISFVGSQCGICTTVPRTVPEFAVSTWSSVPSSVCSIGSIAKPMFFSKRGE